MSRDSRVRVYEQIRRAHDREGLSMRALARRFGVHRRDVRRALASPVPPERKRAARPAPKLEAWKPLIDGWLAEDRSAPR
jgi:transposase